MKTRKNGKKIITQFIFNRVYLAGKPLFYKDAKRNETDNPILPRMVGNKYAKDDANHKICRTIHKWNRKSNIIANELTLGENVVVAPNNS